ncbi:MAG: glycoside hydrolase family 3 N-terminal domain-containing protein [Chlamydiota bacterium]|jgi:beta-glucosidase-like glycosyl hydrolase
MRWNFIISFICLCISVFGNNTLNKKIGSLFIAPACCEGDENHRKDLQTLIQDFHVRAFLVKGGNPNSQKNLITYLESLTSDPLLFCMDAEWGLGMRMKEETSYPRNLTLGAVQNDKLLYLLGQQIGRDCLSTGATLNFAPVVDVNTNPKNPIIHMRSFGDDPEMVRKKAQILSKGMQDAGLFTCYKHFPGHGDTFQDSHVCLPMVEKTLDSFKKEDWTPYDNAFASVMVAHIKAPHIDPLYPSSLSKKTISYLKRLIDKDTVIISDALNMKALTNHYSVEEIACLAYDAGIDMLLYGSHRIPVVKKIMQNDIPNAYFSLMGKFQEGSFSEKELDARLKKINKLKKRSSFFKINKKEGLSIKQALFEEAMTLVHNKEKVLPLTPKTKINFLQIGTSSNKLLELLQKDLQVTRLSLEDRANLFDLVDPLVVSVNQLNILKPNCGLSDQVLELLKKAPKNTIFVLLGSPYCLKLFKDCPNVLLAYEEDEMAEIAAYKVLSGKIAAKGKLPIKID